MKNDGWKSRKLWLSVLAMGLILTGFILCGKPASLFTVYCSAILGAAFGHATSNLIEKLKAPTAPPSPPAAP